MILINIYCVITVLWYAICFSTYHNGGTHLHRPSSQANNYRSISLVSVVSKVMEKAVNIEVLEYLESKISPMAVPVGKVDFIYVKNKRDIRIKMESKLNCEVLNDKLALEVRWAVAGESIVLQLVGKLEPREYMSFGLSGDDSKNIMIGGDVVVAWVDQETLKGYAQDYYLADKSQCSGPTGSCPDNRLADNTNNIRLLNAAMVNGYSIVTYQRPLKASDEFDRPIFTNQSQAIIWAIGPLNQRDEVSFHSSYLKSDSFIDFARPAKWNCPLPEGELARKSVSMQDRQQSVTSEESPEYVPTQATEPEELVRTSTTSAPRRGGGNRRRVSTRRQPTTEEAEEGQASLKEPTRTRDSNKGNQRGTQTRTVSSSPPVSKRDAWYIPPIQCYEPEDGVFYAQMGPTGGKKGYPAITGHVGWGISWYINGLLIPEVNVVRGKTYTFVVEGGNNPEVSAKYHPFYITDDPIGGYVYKTPEEQREVRIFAGAAQAQDGSLQPTGTGRLCHWTHTGDLEADDFDSFGAYQRTLQLKCDAGEPGFIQWTPDKDTPDTVYYQCFTHRHLGWKINVHDSCDVQGAASEPKPIIVEAPKSSLKQFSDQSNIELEASASVLRESMVIPNKILTEDSTSDNKKSQPTVSEITLDPTTPTSEYNPDQIPNTSLLFKSHHNHPINALSQVNNAGLTYHTPGHYGNYNKDASSFRPSPTIDSLEGFPINSIFKQSISKKITTTQIPLTRNESRPNISKAQTMRNTNMTYISLPTNIDQIINGPFKNDRPTKQSLQILYMPLKQTFMKNQNIHSPNIFNGYRKPVFKIKPQKLHRSVLYGIQPKYRPYSNIRYVQHNTPSLINTSKVSNHIQTHDFSETLPTEIKHVEISPEQASTEREPEIQTASSLISIHPPSSQIFKSPVNTGFKPGSIIIEGGFKPLMGKGIEDRVDLIEPQVDLEGQTGVMKVKGKKFEREDQNEILKPLFSGSSTEKISKQKYKEILKEPRKKEIITISLYPRSLVNSDTEPEMAAAQKVESFYLPPPGQTEKPKALPAKQPSEIDFETPVSSEPALNGPSDTSPDIVVTYDGKRVSGASLTAKPFEKSTFLGQRGSKAAELIKSFPQSVPYRGDLPPLTQNVLFNIKSHHANNQPAVLSRNLDTPLPPPYGSTKLTRVTRFAHHTPEHTAEQIKQNQTESNTNSVTSGSESMMQFSLVSLVFIMVLTKTLVNSVI